MADAVKLIPRLKTVLIVGSGSVSVFLRRPQLAMHDHLASKCFLRAGCENAHLAKSDLTAYLA
jgi:hypothetical protein